MENEKTDNQVRDGTMLWLLSESGPRWGTEKIKDNKSTGKGKRPKRLEGRDYQKKRKLKERIKQNHERKRRKPISKILIEKAKTIKRNASVLLTVGVFGIMLLMVLGMFTSCVAMFGDAYTATMSSTYMSSPKELDGAEAEFSQLENNLQKTIDEIEQDNPGYDEYDYNLSEIGHDPYVLISHLSAAHGIFTAAQVSAEIQNLFDEMYTLTLTPDTETRKRTVTDSETGEEKEEEYTVSILRVVLTRNNLDEIVRSHMNVTDTALYEMYNQTHGAIQRFASPVDYYWYNYVTSYYGYRFNPNTGNQEFHRGLDIAVPEGAQVYATHAGTVTEAAYDTYYGYYAVISDSEGYITKYGHLDNLQVAAGQRVTEGTILGLSGSTGITTGSHLHVECMYNGEYYNPLFYFLAGTQTMYGENTGGSGAIEHPSIIPGHFSDAQAEALIREAEKYLNMPYVWGGNSPVTGFDCSGYVSYVIKHSGVKAIERMTAQDLYNMTAPISVGQASPGDLIFFQGTYSAAHPVTHVGIYIGNSQMIHCGDPIKVSSITTPYWQQHFYGFGRIQ